MSIENLVLLDEWNQPKPYVGTGRNVGIQLNWTNNGQQHAISVADKERHTLGVHMSPDNEALVLVFGSLENYTTTANAGVFNADGSLRFFVEPPEPISDEFKEYAERVGRTEALHSVRIIQPAIYPVQGKEQITFWIGFDYDWYELRVFDPRTGKFGECIGTGRV